MPTDRIGNSILLGVMFDTVEIKIVCDSDYGAQVLYDDLVDRLQAGQGIILAPGQKVVLEPTKDSSR